MCVVSKVRKSQVRKFTVIEILFECARDSTEHAKGAKLCTRPDAVADTQIDEASASKRLHEREVMTMKLRTKWNRTTLMNTTIAMLTLFYKWFNFDKGINLIPSPMKS